MDDRKPPLTSAALAAACEVTPQAVNGWRKTGRVSKRYLVTIAQLTSTPLERLLGEHLANTGTGDHLVLDEDETRAIQHLRASPPEWRRYVLGLAVLERRQQTVLLTTLQQTLGEYRVRPVRKLTREPLYSSDGRNKRTPGKRSSGR